MKTGKLIPKYGILAAWMAVVIAALQPASATEIYTWVDENGVPHFSDTRPMGAGVETLTIRESRQLQAASPDSGSTGDTATGTGDTPLTAAQQRRQHIANERRAQQDEREQVEQICTRHRDRLAKMEPTTRVYFTDEKGETVRLDDEQRVFMIEESKNYLAENCN